MTILSRTNLCTNPSFETSTAGWTADFGTVTPTLSQASVPYPGGAGTKSLKVTFHGDTNEGAGVHATFTSVIGLTYTASVWVYAPGGSPQATIQPGVPGPIGFAMLYDQWQRISTTFTAGGTTSTVTVDAWEFDAANSFWYIDAVLFEQTATLLPFFDGNTTGASWTGTANLSTSTLSFDDVPALPSVVVEFDAKAPQPGEFLLGTSALDGTDSLTVSPRWVTVDAATVNEVDIVRGRTDINSPVQAGETTLRCDNWTGNFDPDNPDSIYNAVADEPYLQPGMLCRVSALFPSGGVFTAATLFVGRLEDAVPDKGMNPASVLTFVDDMTFLGQANVTSFDNPVRSGDTTAQRISWGLAQVQRLYGTPSLSANLVRLLLPTYGGDTVLDELNMVAVAEAGRLFVDRSGNVIATAHADEFTQPVVAALDDGSLDANGIGYIDIAVSSGSMQIINAAQVDRYNRSDTIYPSFTAADQTSIGRYGLKAPPPVVASLLQDSDAQALATYLATRRSRPQSRIDSVTVDFAGNPAAAPLLTADMGMQVTVTRRAPYTNGPQALTLKLAVEGVRWSISTDYFRLTMATTPTDAAALFGSAGPFTLDSSSLDGPDILTPY